MLNKNSSKVTQSKLHETDKLCLLIVDLNLERKLQMELMFKFSNKSLKIPQEIIMKKYQNDLPLISKIFNFLKLLFFKNQMLQPF